MTERERRTGERAWQLLAPFAEESMKDSLGSVTRLVQSVGEEAQRAAKDVHNSLIEHRSALTAVDNTILNLTGRLAKLEADGGGGGRNITVTLPDGKKKRVTGAHKAFPTALYWLSKGVNVYLVGPSGTGKTHMGKQLAEALDKDFLMLKMHEQVYPSSLFGQRYADGSWKRTSFWTAYTGYLDHPILGGETRKKERATITLVDEIDKMLSNTASAFHTALDGEFSEFYDEVWEKQEGFGIVATGNTHGDGLSAKYNSSNRQDEAFKNRFVYVYVDYDEVLERELYGDSAWLRYCQAVRSVCHDNSIPVDISMRQVSQGLAALSPDFPGSEKDVTRQVIWARFQPATVEQRVRSLMETKHGAKWDSLAYWGEVIEGEKAKPKAKPKVPGLELPEVKDFGDLTPIEPESDWGNLWV